MPQLEGNDDYPAALKHFSCLACRQRKIKCNRQDPCLNCKRSGSQCNFIPPVRGKPKRKKTPTEGLHARLKRYEELLKSYGAMIEPSETYHAPPVSDSNVNINDDTEYQRATGAGSFPVGYNKSRSRLVSQNGSSRYFESGFWSNIGDGDVDNPGHSGIDERPSNGQHSNVREPGESSDPLASGTLVLNTSSMPGNLSTLHLPTHTAGTLLDIYVQRVDPIVKILHIPTFQSTLTAALQSPSDMTKSVEAIIFSFYLASMSSLNEIEFENVLGQQKTILIPKYKAATHNALTNADFMSTSSLPILQAYVMFLVAMSADYRSDSLFVLSGVAVRIGRRMGMHKDGAMLGLPPFETEIRRRLWWHIVHYDFLISDLSGTKPSMDLFDTKTKTPLNVNDADLTPGMINAPLERKGITSIALCLIRCDVMEFLRTITPPRSSYTGRWNNLSSSSATLLEKDNLVIQMEDKLENKYLRYHDPSDPLHLFASILVRASICKMKLFAHNPRQFAFNGIPVPQSSRDIIFTNGMKFLEYAILVQRNESVEKFRSQLSTAYLWDPILYVLIEIRCRKNGIHVDRAWKLIGEIFDNYPSLWKQASELMHSVLGRMILKVWNECASESVGPERHFPGPEFIIQIRSHCTPTKSPSNSKDAKTLPNTLSNPVCQPEVADASYDSDIPSLDFVGSYDFSGLLSFDMESNDWDQWERLLGEGV